MHQRVLQVQTWLVGSDWGIAVLADTHRAMEGREEGEKGMMGDALMEKNE